MTWLDRMTARVAQRGFAPASSGFFFLRHGETAENRARICQGQSNVPLNQEGIEQAARAAAILSEKPISEIVSSDLRRVQLTIAPLLARNGLPTRLDARLRERGFGVHEGHKLPAELWASEAERVEPIEAFAVRVLDAVEEAAASDNRLVAAHGGILRVLAAATGLVIQPWAYTNALPMRFDRDGTGWRAQAFTISGTFDVTSPLPEGITVHGIGSASDLGAGRAA